MIQGYAIPNATMLGNNGAYKSEFYKALEGAKAAGATVEDAPCLLARGVNAYNAGLPSTPSLLIVPQFYKEGNLYQDVPPFVAEDSTMRFAVSRNTTATRVNASGLIESVASGVLRLDYPIGGGCPAALIEPAATNLASRSEEFDNASWFKVGINTTGTPPWVNVETAPNGTMTADKIIATAASGNHYINRAASTQTGQHTFSVFAKAAEYGFIRLQDINAGKYNVRFDLINGTATGTGASIENYGNGWYRCIVTYDGGGANVANGLMGIPTSGTTFSYTGDGTSGIFVWGAQLETGAIPTSYIPTTTGAVSRAADVISASGALVSGLIGQTEGTIYAEVDVKALQGTVAKTFIDIGATNNRIFIGFTSLASNTIRLQIDTSANPARVDIRSTVSSAGIIKVAAAYQSGNCVLYVNGVAGTVSANDSLSFSTLSSVFIGQTIAGTAFLNDRIRAAALYTTRLTDAQLAELTRL
jgi:hypothetical protein